MTKITHLTSVHSPFDTRIFLKECKTLAAAGYEVVLIVPHDRDEIVDGVQIRAISKPKNRRERMVGTVLQVLKRALDEDAEVYHFHDPELIPIGLLLKVKGKCAIYDVHETVPEDILGKTWIAPPLRNSVAWSVRHLENYAAKRFDAVVAATPFISDRFLKLGCRAVNVNNYPILSELYLHDVDWSQKERAVGYVGGIGKIRGIFEIVEALEQTNAKLLLAGQFSDLEQRDRVAAMPGWTQVEELGQLNRKEVAQTLAKVMAGLVLFHPTPYHVTAQPNKMFEYMSAGIPVIASEFALWKQIIEGNQCGLCVDPMNPPAIAEAIQWIIDHPDEAKLMGENGRKAVEKEYNWKIESVSLLNSYESVLSKSKKP
jgi:hypothetical protein